MSLIVPNEGEYQWMLGNLRPLTDTVRIALLDDTFVPNAINHSNYSDVSGVELPTGNGYTQNTKVISGIVITKNFAGSGRARMTMNNVQWVASGGNIGPAKGFAIYKWTGSAATSTIMLLGSFTSIRTAPDGFPFDIIDILNESEDVNSIP